MEFVEGESLALRISRGALPAYEAAQIILGIHYALGAFFEMLTGQSSFPGESFGEIAHSVLHARPPALSGSPAISALGRIVSVAMARDPDGRYSSAEAMASDIRAALLLDGIATAASARPLRRLIVLLFRLLRPSTEIQFLAFSLPEAITVSLGGLENLTVRSSIVLRYSDDSPDLQKIATEAEVDVVLTGALLQLGKQLRSTAQPVEARSGTLLRSHSSQGTTHELLELHDDLVRRVVDSILPSLTASEQQSLQQERPASPTIYELYLRANEYSRQWKTCPLPSKCTNAASPPIPPTLRLGQARPCSLALGQISIRFPRRSSRR